MDYFLREGDNRELKELLSLVCLHVERFPTPQLATNNEFGWALPGIMILRPHLWYGDYLDPAVRFRSPSAGAGRTEARVRYSTKSFCGISEVGPIVNFQ